MAAITKIQAQPRQLVFLSSSADIAIFGGSAGGGKTWSLLTEPLRHINNKNFGAVFFRRTIPEVTNEGGPWDEAGQIYPLLNAKSNENEHQYSFASGMRVTFAHMQHEKDKLNWKSSQIPLIIFDQLETFTETQFFYMLSRNRSMCGIDPYIRASCNPEPGWLADFLDWWIGEDGYAIPERSGIVRWMVRVNDVIQWADTKNELIEKYSGCNPKSVTFILSTLYDNKVLMEKDPGYLANLQALPMIDRERLLGDPERGGNWKIKPSAGKIFNRAWFVPVDLKDIPPGGVMCRRWDFAATEKQLNKNDPDFTASCLMLFVRNAYYILDVTAEQLQPSKIDPYFDNLTNQDAARGMSEKRRYMARWEQEPGSAGKRESWRTTVKLAGIDAKGVPAIHDKLTNWKPFATMAENGYNIYIVKAPWNELFLNHMHGQPELSHDDIADAAAGAYNDLVRESKTLKAGSHQG